MSYEAALKRQQEIAKPKVRCNWQQHQQRCFLAKAINELTLQRSRTEEDEEKLNKLVQRYKEMRELYG